MKRMGRVERKTSETDIQVELLLDGQGKSAVKTGIGFFDHLLTALSKHARFDLQLQAKGDLNVDAHHTVEDVGIALGQALDAALGDRRGIQRFGTGYCPLDEALARAVVDISGRNYLAYRAPIADGLVGMFPVELMEEFLRALSSNAKITLHIDLLFGSNRHHCLEAVAKSLAVALRQAVQLSGETDIPSTKGTLR